MPRRPRLDGPDLLQHVTAQGIEGLAIFRDDHDRGEFVARLGELVTAAGASLYTWCLLPDQFHLVLRPGDRRLAWLMRRLMTGHAVSYNLRHGRSGHVFQSRYRSVVVEEEPYFCDLVRYVALHLVRRNTVRSIEELDRHPWSGHAALVGARSVPWQDIEAVLGRFAPDREEAVARYREFVVEGCGQGRKTNLPATGKPHGYRPLEPGRGRADERILGGEQFVEAVRRASEQNGLDTPRRGWEAILREVTAESGIGEARILSASRERAVSRVRRHFLLRSLEEGGLSITQLGRICGMNPASVSRAVELARSENGKRRGNEEASRCFVAARTMTGNSFLIGLEQKSIPP
ncbi:MAG: hypothetical protein HY900_20480 [Deltaproteobacteria bacterium]|nr:hypothetical protein [Deltaproteobacteria bacterium]